MRLSDSKAQARLPTACPECCEPQPWAKIRRMLMSSGAMSYPYVCKTCGHKTSVCEAKANVRIACIRWGISEDQIPLIENPNGLEQCEVCGELGAELHHYAPQHLFDDANLWATGYLCKYHHALWHKRIKDHR